MRYNRLYKDNNFLTPTTYTQELSEYAVGLKYEDIPPEVVERAKIITTQVIGVALAAKDGDHDHVRYEAADLVYHLMVCLERQGVSLEELAGELGVRPNALTKRLGRLREGLRRYLESEGVAV